MAKKKPEEQKPEASASVLAYLRGELARAEAAVKNGPNGQGWKFNESKLPAAEELATFLRAQLAALTP